MQHCFYHKQNFADRHFVFKPNLYTAVRSGYINSWRIIIDSIKGQAPDKVFDKRKKGMN